MVNGPFLFVTDLQQADVRWALVAAPVLAAAHRAQLMDLRRAGYRFAGMPSYLSFPGPAGDAGDAVALCEAWCHGFRDPDRYLPSGVPRVLISHSDFTDDRWLERARSRERRSHHDFAYLGGAEPWQRAAKSWRLAARCIPRLCRELGLRALVIGTPTADFRPQRGVRFVPRLPWPDLLTEIAGSKFVLAPNVCDPSPRVIAEALCLDVPVVVNRRILGGWKYVNTFTGEFFDGEQDVVEAASRCLSRPHSPRRWFRSHYGPHLAGARLLALLRTLDSRLQGHLHLLVTDEPAARQARAP